MLRCSKRVAGPANPVDQNADDQVGDKGRDAGADKGQTIREGDDRPNGEKHDQYCLSDFGECALEPANGSDNLPNCENDRREKENGEALIEVDEVRCVSVELVGEVGQDHIHD